MHRLVTALCAFAALAGLIIFDGASNAEEPTVMDDAEEKWTAHLSPDTFRVTQCSATEPPFRNAYWNHHEEGLYVDAVTREPLFSSQDKFDSGTGWPSFTRPIAAAAVEERADESHGMRRTEVRSTSGDAHLGHLFDDGPGPTGQRYCINSAALDFVPVARMAAEGYGDLLPLFGREAPRLPPGAAEAARMSRGLEVATLAGGCFWGLEELLRQVPGVVDTQVGYTGGDVDHATYDRVKTGRTGHAEAVRVVFDRRKLQYEELLRWFFRMHDPTTPGRQGNDVGTQYRSAIFVHTDRQRRVAERLRAEVDASGQWPARVVTEIVPARAFWKAEEFHQDYLQKHPGGYTCHWIRS